MFEFFVTLGGDNVIGVDCVKGIGVWLAGLCFGGMWEFRFFFRIGLIWGSIFFGLWGWVGFWDL